MQTASDMVFARPRATARYWGSWLATTIRGAIEDQRGPRYYNDLLFGNDTTAVDDFINVQDYFRENSAAAESPFTYVPADRGLAFPSGEEGVLPPIVYPDSPLTPDLDESLFATVNLEAGGGTDQGGSILFVNLRASNGKYVRVLNVDPNDGSDRGVSATRSPNASDTAILSWDEENFKIIDIDGGQLQYGDTLLLQTADNHYLHAQDGKIKGNSRTVYRERTLWSRFAFESVKVNGDTGEIAFVDKDSNGINDAGPIQVRLRVIEDGSYVALQGDNTLSRESLPNDPPDRFQFTLEPTKRSAGRFLRTVIKEAARLSEFDFSTYAGADDVVTTAELSIIVVESRGTTTLQAPYVLSAASMWDSARPQRLSPVARQGLRNQLRSNCLHTNSATCLERMTCMG